MPKALSVLRQEHTNMAMLLDVLDRQLAVAKAGEAPAYDIVKGILDYFLTYPELYHHPKEDLVYLRLRARDGAEAEPFAGLLTGHEDIALLTRRFARATVDQILNPGAAQWQWFTSLGREFVDTNRRHMAEEEEHFFPLALRVLSPEDWAAIESQVTDWDDPLFGRLVERRFRGLHQMILDLERENLESRRS
jgi:hemerythrin-like domain-containing protein